MVKQYALVSDFGKKVDATIIGIVETICRETDNMKKQYEHRLIDLFKFEKLDWPDLIKKFQNLYEIPELKNCPIIVDGNGLGDVVISYMKKAKLIVVPVLTTSGESETIDEESGAFHVAKKLLVSSFMQSISLKKWKFSNNLPHKDEMLLQFENFQLKISKAGNETYENVRDSVHDDMVTMCMIGNYVLRKRFIDAFKNKSFTAKKKQREYNPRKLMRRKR